MSAVPGVTVEALLRSHPETFGLPIEVLAGEAGLSHVITIPHVQKTGLALAGCSQKTQDNVDKTAESVGEDVGGVAAKASDAAHDAADAVSEAADKGAAAVSEAAGKASAAADHAGDKIEEGIDKGRHGDSTDAAKAH